MVRVMANLKRKNSVLEIVDNQLKANDPPCTKDVFEKLLDAGYSEAEAKDKIGAVVLEEIYDILKAGKNFDAEKYRASLEEMLQRSIDHEDDHHIRTEWDEWDELSGSGYECFSDRKPAEGLLFWQKAWDVFLSAMEQTEEKGTLYALIESQNYEYPIDGWLQDYEMELGNAGKYEDRIALCEKVLELFDWEEEDDSCFRCGIGESLFWVGKAAESIEYYENWLKDDPQNANGISSFSWILSENGDAEKAYEVIKEAIWGVPCCFDNSFLFTRAQQLAEQIGKEEEGRWYRQQLDEFEGLFEDESEDGLGVWEIDDDGAYDDFDSFGAFHDYGFPKQTPIVKEKKVYPNDPCPCGSGKKYKKCCGKR